MNNVFCAAGLAEELRRLGVAAGDVLLVHSSLRAIGPTENGAETVVAALRMAIGATGTLLMPSFPSGSEFLLAQSGICFDVRTTPSGCGYLTEYFRTLPGVLRSLSSTHSLAGLGPAAAALFAGHERCAVTVGHGSPFERLIAAHGKILMLGTTIGSCTTMHYWENTGGAPTVSTLCFDTWVIDGQGRRIKTSIHPHLPGVLRNYAAVQPQLTAAGMLKTGAIGAAEALLIDAAAADGLLRRELACNPLLLMKVFNPEV